MPSSATPCEAVPPASMMMMAGFMAPPRSVRPGFVCGQWRRTRRVRDIVVGGGLCRAVRMVLEFGSRSLVEYGTSCISHFAFGM